MSYNASPSLAVHNSDIRRVELEIDETRAIRPRFEQVFGAGAQLQPMSVPSYSYNATAAYLSSLASAWAYSDVTALKDQLEDAMQTKLECMAFEAHNPTLYLDTDAYFLTTARVHPQLGKLGILAFRGTEFTDVADLLADAYVEMLPFPHKSEAKGRVHAGFHEGAAAVWKPVQKMLADKDVNELLITGHSLGGALAIMTTAQLYASGYEGAVARVRKALRGIYTFGQPAVGDARFCSWLLQNCGGMIFRHVYGKDVVPFLPTVDVNPEYAHLPTGIWSCARNEESWSGPSTTTAFKLARHFGLTVGAAGLEFVTRRFHMGLAKRLFNWKYSLDDHSPINYMRISKESVPVDGSSTLSWGIGANGSGPSARESARTSSSHDAE